MKVLLIPDSHVSQDQSLERFRKLGNYIVETRPEAIISMGDFMSLKSISHWDDSKRLTMEGRRYRDELSNGNIALDLIEKPMKELNDSLKSSKQKQYRPKKFYLEGNHCAWLEKYVEQNPQMEGHLDIKTDLHLDVRGWDVIKYKHNLDIDDVLFTHVPIAANQQPVSGKYALHTAMTLSAKSLVFAHTHRLEQVNVKRHGDDRVLQGLTCGCFFEDEDEYAEGGANNYWKGIVELNIFQKGRFDVTTISMERLYREY